jgi:hypothetical protein
MTSNDSHAVGGYMCAQQNNSGSQSIGAGKTHSYSVYTNAEYFQYFECHPADTSSVTVTWIHGAGFASYTATNWLTPSNTRHWGVAMLWTPMGYGVSGLDRDCSAKSSPTWTVMPNLLAISSLTVSGMPTGGATAGTTYPITVTVHPASATGQVAVTDPVNTSTAAQDYAVAGATLVNGTATIKWVPACTGCTANLTVVYKGDGRTTPATTGTYAIPVTGGTGVAISSVTKDAGSTTGATATLALTPATTRGPVALISVNADGSRTQVGTGVAKEGSATVRFSYVNGTVYNLIGAYVDTAGDVLGQSYPLVWNSATGTIAAGTAPTAIFDPGAFSFGPASTTTLDVKVVEAKRKITAKVGDLQAKCPFGMHLLNADAWTDGPVDELRIDQYTRSGAHVSAPREDIGHILKAQILCRPRSARQVIQGAIALGTSGPNLMGSKVANAMLYGGEGRDRITASGNGAAVWGGVGDDTLVVEGRNASAVGGPGNDVLFAYGTTRTFLWGGDGADMLSGSAGPTFINAQDGAGGDIVTCQNRSTRVMMDVGDTIKGPCMIVGRPAAGVTG